MQPTEPQRAPSPTASATMPPQLERTLIASGWALAELRSPVRSPLANLRVADLDASVAARPLAPSSRPASASRGADPNDTRAAADWAWVEAFAALGGASPGETLITPSRARGDARSSATRRAKPTLDVTRVLPRGLAHALAPVRPDAAPAEAQNSRAPIPAAAAAPPELAALPPVPDRPQLVPGVQLLGTLRDSGFAEQQWLAQRGPAFVQLSELLYRVLEQVDGQRDLEQIAALVRETTGRPVSANNVRLLIAARLLPLGLIVPVGGLPAAGQQSAPRSPLAVTLRLGFLRAEWVEPVARVLQVGFWPPVLMPVLLLVAAGQGWLFLVHGAATPLEVVLQEPALLLGISTFILLSAVFHEFGHAAALRFGGGRARGIGFGVYFIYPAFYTDCTDSYRLGRWGRLRTDLGGVYFDLITTLALILAYVATRQELLLATVILLDLEILDQFNPIARFDGYWALADLIGVPDFFSLMGPVLGDLRNRVAGALFNLRRAQPSPQDQRAASPAGGRPQGPTLKGWVKTVFLAYTCVTVPFLAIFLGALLASAPSFLGVYLDSLAGQVAATLAASRAGARLEEVLAGGQALTLLVTAALLLYGIGNAVRSVVRGVWRWGGPTPRRRALSLVALAVGAALLALAWRPQVEALVPHFAQIIQQLLRAS